MAENLVIFGKTLSNVTGIKATNTTGNVITYVDTHDANAVASDILNGKTAYVNGAKITGTNSGSSGGGGGLSDHSIENTITTIYLSDCSHIYENAFANCGILQSLYLLGNGSSICTLMNANAFANTPMSNSTLVSFGWGSIYVPSSMYNSYVAASNWSKYSARIVSYGESEVEPEYTFIVKNIIQNGTYRASDDGIDGYTKVIVDIPADSFGNFGSKTITQNGTYNASNDGLDGYSVVTIDVSATSYIYSLISISMSDSMPESAINIDPTNYMYYIVSDGFGVPTANAIDYNAHGFSIVTVSASVKQIEGDDFIQDLLIGAVQSYYINESITKLKPYAFYDCSSYYWKNGKKQNMPLEYLGLPNCLELESDALCHCMFRTISLPKCEIINDYGMREANLDAIVLPKCKTIGAGAFEANYGLSGLYLLDSSVVNLTCTIDEVANVFAYTPLGSISWTSSGDIIGRIYVPSSLYNSYMTDEKWRIMSSVMASI